MSTDPNPVAAGVSQIINQPLPTDPAAAQTMRDTLTADSEYMKDWRADRGKQSTLAYLRWVAQGLPAGQWGAPPQDASAVEHRAADRVVAQMEQHAQALDKHFDLTPRQQFEVLSRRPVYQSEKDQAAREYERNTRDRAFMEKWRSGDRDALTKMYLLNAIKAAPVSSGEAETLAWDKANPFEAPA